MSYFFKTDTGITINLDRIEEISPPNNLTLGFYKVLFSSKRTLLISEADNMRIMEALFGNLR